MAKDSRELRKYIRLNSVFPVGFSLYYDKANTLSQEYQGFTCNVSDGGLCISVRNLNPDDEALLLDGKAYLALEINIPLFLKPAKAKAAIAWIKKDQDDPSKKTYLLGLYYKDIDPKDKNRITRCARRMRWLPRIASVAIVILFSGFLALSFYHLKSRKQNHDLVKQLVSISEVKSSIERKMNEAMVRKEMLEKKLLSGGNQMQLLRDEILSLNKKTEAERARLNRELEKALSEKEALDKKIEALSDKNDLKAINILEAAKIDIKRLEAAADALQMELYEVSKKAALQTGALEDKINNLEKEKASFNEEILLAEAGKASLQEQLARVKTESNQLEEAGIDTMLGWIRAHQTKKTGLVLSYEGDKELKDFGFTYDEALASTAFLISGSVKESFAILSFYANTAKNSDGLFYNAYDVKNGLPVEYTIHSGPNIWIAIAACHYARKTKDRTFIGLAQRIADKMIRMQNKSSDGSIPGGPDITWVSTEHNLDAYALFTMLYELTNDKRYKAASDVTLNWLKGVGYNRPEGRFMRGRGDSTIATDTFSWGIASIGPEVLLACGMNPDGIMEFAESECKTEAVFIRPDGQRIDVTGFDFSKAAHIGRGGIISTEWTAQMVVAFKIMADYYKEIGNADKRKIYSAKADYYLSQLGQMVISSPSPTGQGEGCLPYASIDNVDTGHGWRVANGKQTGSLSGTIYYIFAYKGFNPLAFD